MKTPLLYALHSGNLYGTEQMALATAQGLRAHFAPVLFAPPGPALCEAQKLGLATHAFRNPREFVAQLRPYLAAHRRLALCATGLVHSLAAVALNAVYRREIKHLHLVHGGTDEHLSYGRKRYLNRANVTFVAVSAFVKERLTAHGVRPEKIVVIENFLPVERVAQMPQRPAFARDGVRRLLVVSRLDPIKKVGLLLDALDALARAPALKALPVEICGTGWEMDALRQRAAATHPNVTFAGFTDAAPAKMAASDLLVHTCPTEPFGLALIEAMAAGLPVLAPNTGGAGAVVENGVSGFHFRADDAAHLAARLQELAAAPAQLLNHIAAGARRALATRFAAAARLDDYQRLLA